MAQQDQLLAGMNPLVRQDAESLAAAAAEMGLDYIRLLRMVGATLQRYGPTIVSAVCRRAFGSMEFAGEEAQQLDLDSVWVQAVASAQMHPRSQDGNSGFRKRQRAQLHTPAPLSEPQQPATMNAASAQPACTTAQGTADSGGAHSCMAPTAQSAAVETLMRAAGVDRATALTALQQATSSTPGLSGADVRRAIAAAGEVDSTEESMTRQCKTRPDPLEPHLFPNRNLLRRIREHEGEMLAMAEHVAEVAVAAERARDGDTEANKRQAECGASGSGDGQPKRARLLP